MSNGDSGRMLHEVPLKCLSHPTAHSLQRLSELTTFAIRFMLVNAQVVPPFVDLHDKIGAKCYMHYIDESCEAFGNLTTCMKYEMLAYYHVHHVPGPVPRNTGVPVSSTNLSVAVSRIVRRTSPTKVRGMCSYCTRY